MSSDLGGTRGGRDQFSWDQVKDDKDRECYLGHSLMAPIGRWQKGRDLLWYTKDKQGDDQEAVRRQRQLEIQAIKDAEADALSEALGFAPQKRRTSQLTESELQAVLKREKAIEQEDETEEDVRAREADRVQGLGYQEPRRFGPVSTAGASNTAASSGGLMRLEKGQVLPGRTPIANTQHLAEMTSTDFLNNTRSTETREHKKNKKEKKEKKEKRKKEKKSRSSRRRNDSIEDGERREHHKRSRRDSPYRHERRRSHDRRDDRRDYTKDDRRERYKLDDHSHHRN
ncbi:kinase phosphorylation protein-domain-containing protein [Syncephalis fuscata]|nr:kinase phosphorylation protein-domain-containing protein [Syncephalis fuscata]